MQRPKTVLALLTVLIAAGCATDSRTERPEGSSQLGPLSGPVCFLSIPLPPEVKAQPIGLLRSSKRWYGSTAEVLQAAADEARASGANIVANVKTGHTSGAYAWARPVATGISYRLDDERTIDCAQLGGTLR